MAMLNNQRVTPIFALRTMVNPRTAGAFFSGPAPASRQRRIAPAPKAEPRPETMGFGVPQHMADSLQKQGTNGCFTTKNVEKWWKMVVSLQ